MNASDPSAVPRPGGWTAENEARWGRMFPRIVRTEGSRFVNDPKDRGGATKYGISLRFLAIEGKLNLDHDQYADFDLNRDGSIDALDIQLLQPANAEALYLRLFHIETGFWRLPAPFDMALFDMGVNAGTGTAVKLLQRAVNKTTAAGLLADGRLGPATRGKLVEAIKQGPVLTNFRKEAATYYRAIVANDNDQERFLGGWLNRASELGRVA